MTRHRSMLLAAAVVLALAPSATAAARAAAAAPGPLRFSAAQHVAAGTGPWLFSVGDVLGNGGSDLAVANIVSLGPDGASLLINTTTPGARQPSFAPADQFNGDATQAPLLADFTGDGLPDLVVCDEPVIPHGRCSVYPNTTPTSAATPSFGAPVVLQTGDTPEVLAAADMTGDGKLDLIVANFGSLGPGAITIFRNTTPPGATTPTFAPPQYFTGGIGAEGMAVADLNGDGEPDIVTGNTAGDNVTAMVNETPPGATQIRLSAPQVLPATLGPTAVVAADLNGDGKLDLAVGSSFTPGSDDLNVYMNETPQGSTRLRFTHQVFAADPGIEGISAADFTGNGQSDIAYAAYRSATGEPTVSVCGTGGLLPPLCQDLGGNGLGGDVGVMLNTTPKGSMVASFAPPHRLASGLGTVAVISGDFNGDGKPDIAAGNALGTGPSGVTIFTNQTRWAHPPVIPAQPVPGIGPGLGL